jgi:hypothetical protein
VLLEVEDSLLLPLSKQCLVETVKLWSLTDHELEVLAVVLWEESRTSAVLGCHTSALGELDFVEEESGATGDAHDADRLVLAVANVLESGESLVLAEDELALVLGFAAACHEFADVRLAVVWVCVGKELVETDS